MARSFSNIFPQPCTALLILFLLALWFCPVPASASGTAYQAKPTEDELIAKGFRYTGEKPDDKFNEIPGQETTIRVYKKGQETVALYTLPNGLVYGYAVKVGSQPITAYIDEYNTGYCDKDVSAGENFLIDFRAYGIDSASYKAGNLKRK